MDYSRDPETLGRRMGSAMLLSNSMGRTSPLARQFEDIQIDVANADVPGVELCRDAGAQIGRAGGLFSDDAAAIRQLPSPNDELISHARKHRSQ